jgi:hypothetical protein
LGKTPGEFARTRVVEPKRHRHSVVTSHL